MTAKVTAPVAGFSGVVANVTFVDGVGETDSPGAIAYFKRHGYDVVAKEKPAPVKKSAALKPPSEK